MPLTESEWKREVHCWLKSERQHQSHRSGHRPEEGLYFIIRDLSANT